MKTKVSKFALTLMLVLCMAVSVFAVAMAADVDSDGIAWEEYTQEELSSLEGDIPSKDGYLFGGWYTQKSELDGNGNKNCLKSAAIPEGATSIYAKFVPKAVLSVKAQLSADDLEKIVQSDDDTGLTASLRVVTTVDSLMYQKVGFEITYTKKLSDGTTKDVVKNLSSNQVYTQLYATDSTNVVANYKPNTTFNAASEYFKAYTLTGIDIGNIDTEISVRPYWVTMDNTTVYGDWVVKTVSEGMQAMDNVYVASYGMDGAAGTEAEPVASISHAIYRTNEGSTITVLDDIEANTLTTVDKSVTVTGDSGVTIYRGTGLGATQMFLVNSGCTLTIESVTLDGRTENEKDADTTVTNYKDNVTPSSQTLITNKGTLIFNNAVVQYVRRTGGGAVCNSSSSVTANNTKFLHNTAAGTGGVFNIGYGSLTATDCLFEDNSASANGGAIATSLASGSTATVKVTVTSCEFNKNIAGGNGGAIYNNSVSKITLNLLKSDTATRECVFKNNEATGSGGAIYAGAVITLTGNYYKFSNNIASNKGGGALALNSRVATGSNLEQCVFEKNEAPQGGAIWANYTNATYQNSYLLNLSDCTFTENKAIESTPTTTYLGGGAIWANSATNFTLTCSDTTKAVFDGNTTYDTSTSFGGAIYMVGNAIVNGTDRYTFKTTTDTIYPEVSSTAE